MKKIVPCALMILVFIALAIGCGGGGDKDKKTPETSAPTTPAQTTPAASPTETVTPTIEPATPTPEPSPTVEPTVQPPPTPTVNPDSAEVVLAPVMDRLIVAFAKIGGQWHAYPGPSTLSLSTLENGQLYWWYATETITLGPVTLYEGWNNMMWLSPSAPIGSALAGYESKLPFVIRMDIQTGKSYLYQSSVVAALTVIPIGQTYRMFVQGTDSPLPQMSTQTR